MRILIVAYYFSPNRGVGAKRPTYWHEKFLATGHDSYVVTATEQPKEAKNIFVVQPTSGDNKFIKDEGIGWRKPLKLFFSSTHIPFDAVIFTGGPFMHFRVIPVVRNFLPKAKILIDFRDPFAHNPRFNSSFVKIIVKRFFEREFIKSADHIITVNEYCTNLLKLKNGHYTIINNGYDERVIKELAVERRESTTQSNKIKFVYAGSFAPDRNPEVFLHTLKSMPSNFEFHHLGNNNHSFNIGDISIPHGLLTYQNTIRILKACHIGVIFTSGHPFESTTKIFDYIACGLGILIISDNGIPSGSLHDITKDYKKTVWVKNCPSDINRYLKDQQYLSQLAILSYDTYNYSREAGFKKLRAVIERIID